MFSEGNFVWIIMSRNDCFGLGLSCRFQAEILYAVCNVGDLWHVLVNLKDGKRVVIAIYSMSTDFVGLVACMEEED